MKLSQIVAGVAGIMTVAAMTASVALAGDHWKFEVVNKSTVAAVEFRTQENGEWSSNWLSERIEPGDAFDMDFGTSEGDCTVRTQIRFTDGTYFDANVNYCDASKLDIYNDKLTWE